MLIYHRLFNDTSFLLSKICRSFNSSVVKQLLTTARSHVFSTTLSYLTRCNTHISNDTSLIDALIYGVSSSYRTCCSFSANCTFSKSSSNPPNWDNRRYCGNGTDFVAGTGLGPPLVSNLT